MKKTLMLLLMLCCSLWAWAQILTDSNLPIVVIETDGGVSIPDEPKVLATMKIIWHQDGSRNYLTDIDNPDVLDYDGRIGIELRGSSSQMLQKKPYGLTTLQDDDVTNNNVSILGMPKENDWVLNSLAFDETGLRDVLSYELSERFGQYAPRRVYCEVMVNGDYKGLYVFMEKIKVDKDRVNIVKMDENCNNYPEVTGGYIMQTDRAEDGYAWAMPTYLQGGWWGMTDYAYFLYVHPKAENITNAQSNYIHDVFNSLSVQAKNQNTSIETGIPSVIDIPSFVDFMMIAEYSSNVDVYMLSTFFHKDRRGKLRAGPIWDYNLAYGHDEFGSRSRYDVWQFDNNDNLGPKFWKDLFNTDEFRCHLARRWHELTQPGQPLDYDLVCARIDEIDYVMLEGVGRDNQRWHKMTNHVGALQDMKDWIQLRMEWLDIHYGDYSACDDVDLPPLVISKINYHPADWWIFNDEQLEFLEITNNGDEEVDLTGVYFRELGVTYSFPEGTTMAPHEAILLCADSVAFAECYGLTPFDQYDRNLSNKSEYLVLVDAWGHVIDEVRYSDSDPWPLEADGEGAFLQLIDLDLDNSLPESWVASYDITEVSEDVVSEGFRMFPNPSSGLITIETRRATSLHQTTTDYRIANVLGQVLMTGLIRGESQQINVGGLPAGMYFVTVGNKTKKLIIR